MDNGISSHVENLGHSLEPVRTRALRTIVAKLDLDLTTVESLVDQPNLVHHLINWLKSGDSLCTDEIIGLIQRLASNKDGVQLLWRYDPEFIILSQTVGERGQEFIRFLHKSIDFEKAEPVRDEYASRISNSRNTSCNTSSSSRRCQSAEGKNKEKKTKKKCCFQDDLTSSELSSLPWDGSKVSSSDFLSSSEPSPEQVETQSIISSDSSVVASQERECSINDRKWPQIRWPSPVLADSDVKVLKTVGNSLNDRDQCREAVNFLSTVVLQDFPPQIFLNDTSVLQSLLKLAEDRTHHQDVVVRCLGELSASLLRFYHFYNDACSCPQSHLSVVTTSRKETKRSKIKPRILYDSILQDISLGISLGDYCGLVLEKVGHRVPGLLRLLSYCVEDVDEFWKIEDNNCLLLKQGIKLAFSRLTANLLKDKAVHPLKRLQSHVGMFALLRSAIPISSAKLHISRDDQLTMYHSLLDPVLQILYPEVQKLFRSYVESFEIKNGIPLKEYFLMVESLDAGAEFMKTTNWRSLDDCLACFEKSLPALELHQQYEAISTFIDFIMKQSNVSPKQIQMIQNVCLKLFASLDINVRRTIYENAEKAVNSFLGPQKSSKNNVPFPELFFVINKKTLWEILSYGITSSDSKIAESSANILVLLLKCQTLVTVSAWREIVSVLVSVFPLLHSLAGARNDFGRAVVSSLDPDVAKEMKLSDLEILKGNVRLMMSKDDRTKDEGTARVIYLVDIRSHSGRHQSFNLSLETGEYHAKAPASYEERSLLRVLEVIKIGSGDVSMLKSAVAQLSLMTEDTSLHILFLDHDGLELTVDFLKNSVELPSSDSQHFFMHAIAIIKNVAESSMQVRNDLSYDLYFFSVLLKGIFLYGDDWRILRDASQLLTLVAYAEIIISKDGKLCFPYAIMQNVKLPYRVAYYGDVSEHQQPSMKGRLLAIPRVQKSLGLRWAAACSETVDDLFESLGRKAPALLPVSAQDLSSLAACSVPYNLKLQLSNLSTAYSHSSASDAIENLSCFLNIAVTVGCCHQLPTLPWEASFKRYLTTLPASVMDQILLTQILKFLNLLLAHVPDERLWMSTIVKDPAFTFNSLLSQLLVADMDETAKELSFEILTLVEICLDDGSNDGWETVVSYLMQCLSQSHSQQFYSIAVMDKLLKCLLKVTEKKMRIKTKSLWKLLNAFHCPTPNTYMGLTITRLTLLCLSNILPLHPKTSEIVKSASEIKWLWEMLDSRDVVVKSASLELLSSLCCDPLTTEQLLAQSTALWDTSLRIALDHNESNLAREQAVNLCNIIVSNSSNKAYAKNCADLELFKCIAVIAARVEFPANSPSLWFTSADNADKEDPENVKHLKTTPTLVTLCCNFCSNLISKDQDCVESIVNQGLMAQLFRQVPQWQSAKALRSQEKVDMFASVCRLLVQCAASPKSSALECVPVMVWLLQKSTYGETIEKTELVIQSVMLLSAIVSSHKGAKVIFTKEAVDTICETIRSPNDELFSAFTAALPPLCPFLTAEASVAIVKGLEKKYDPAHRMLLAAILSSSTAATLAAVECGLLVTIVQSLRETNIKLATTSLDVPRSKKANATLNSLSIDFGLMTNFLAGCVEAKEQCAALGLADALHKLWTWCLLDQDLLCSLLQVLVTFTAECPSAAGSVVMTSNMIGVNQRKTPSPNSLLHAVISLLSKDSYGFEVKIRILEFTSHACQAPESRAVLVKSNIISEFLKFSRLKRSLQVDELEVPWMKFLVVFTYYNEGQPLVKNDEFFSQLMLYMSTGRSAVKPLVMAVFRNLAFNQNSKQKLIVCDRWLKLLANRALELVGAGDELRDLALTVWYLVANSQRGKNAVRMASLDSRLRNAAAPLPDGHQTLEIVDQIATILQPPSTDDIS
ncbi:determination of left/right symmetry [Nesidiocoris tenuis]|uniref:Determination of left/right symmetry n=1 Tax=Nesidiocoris tenuis TaxID=355587 RepID=A0ABN7ASM9_9HEMI|nr:determination of left/right symmetry [Nesidiocoris tenuis]